MEKFIISRLAKQTGYSTAMIRYFEREGLITPAIRTKARYRLFTSKHVEELEFVKKMQWLGFHPNQIRSLREVKLSQLPSQEKNGAIERILSQHRKYVGEQADYFNELVRRVDGATPTFAKEVLADC